jgi:hypothetical protein
MLGIHRTSPSLFGRRATRSVANSRPAHRRRRAWKVEYLEGRTLLSQFWVHNLDDSGDDSLRQAIELSNSTPGPNEIDFAAGLSGTITLTSGELMIANQAVTIHGPGQDLLSVSGNGSSRVFEIASGVTASLSGMTITRGNTGNGGGIHNSGTLTIDACSISGNSAGYGGGISNGGTVTILASTVSGNSAGPYSGGGIFNGGTMTIEASTISGNSTFNDFGGGIENFGTLTLTGCTLSGNSTGGNGGGISNEDYGTVTIVASTISGNSTGYHGGGVYNYNGTMTIDASTISNNSAGLDGDGIYNLEKVSLLTSIVAGNSPSTGQDVSGAIDSLGHNLIGNARGSSGWVDTDLLNVAPKLGPLQDNGGPTWTMALLPGSPAVDAGASVEGLATDQRGVSRTDYGPPDIGAFELEFDGPGATFSNNGPIHVGEPVTVQFSNASDPSPVDMAAGFHYAFATDPVALAGATYENSGSVPYTSFTFSTMGKETVYGRIMAQDNVYHDYSTQFAVILPGSLLVVNNHDIGPGSLRQAIALAPAGDRVLFDISLKGQTITLTIGELVIDKSLDIEGLGAASLTVSGGGSNRVFDIANSSASVRNAGLTITGGRADTGGGIYSAGMVTINACSISGNSTGNGDGGGIVNSGTMTLTNSSITGNVAGTDSWSDGMEYYHGGGYGGGVYNSGTMTLTNSTVSANTSNTGYRGTGRWWVTSWAGDGAGIYNGSGTMTIDASTISGNSAGYRGDGGGIYNVSGTATVVASTISGNSGVGIWNGTGTVTLLTSIVQDGSGEFNSLGHNLIASTEGSSGWVETDLLNRDPKLGPLQDNGGPTWTMALLPGSPAIDTGSNDSVPAGVQYDQRGPGFQRIVNAIGKPTAIVDIGAVEWQPYVASFVASWGTQTAPLNLAADGLRLLPEGRKTDLPWLNVNQLTITLSTAVTLSASDVSVSSTSGTNYGPVTVSGSGTSYTITLGQRITKADRLTIKLNLAGMVSPTFELDVVPGDYNDDGGVNSQDMVGVRNEMLGMMGALPTLFGDINGDGKVDINDYTAVRQRIGSHL